MASSSHQKIQKLGTLDQSIKNLIKLATETRENAYCPYSNFKVGAAVLSDSDKIYTGCNVENLAFTSGICAERCAYSKAVSEGTQKFKAVAIVAQQENGYTPPCGACRQFMCEFGNVKVYLYKPGVDEVLVSELDTLLPLQFQKF